MKTTYLAGEPVRYELPVGDELIPMNPLVGSRLTLRFEGQIRCTACNRLIKKSFNQGYCFPCTQRLAQCDICIVRPELCHFDQGSCRDPEWAREYCMLDHTVYLANSSGIKVGITRTGQQLTRWIDQGALQARPIARVKRRLIAGQVEVALKRHVADKTNWRAMLKGDVPPVDLKAALDRLAPALPQSDDIQPLAEEPISIVYPVLEHPKKIVSLNLDKTPLIEGTLVGIKGQYLMFDTGVINLRKYSGYLLSVIF